MFFKKTVAYCLTILVLLVPLLVSAQMVVTPVFANTTKREYLTVKETHSFSNTFTDDDMTYIYNRWNNVLGSDMTDKIIEVFSGKNMRSYHLKISGDSIDFVASSDGSYYYSTEKYSFYSCSWDKEDNNAGGSGYSSAYFIYYPSIDYFSYISSIDSVSVPSSATATDVRSTLIFNGLPDTFSIKGSFDVEASGLEESVDVTETDSFTVNVTNRLNNSAQYLLYVSPVSAVSGIADSYQKYVWNYQTKQTCYLFRQSFLKDVADSLNDTVDIFGDTFNPTNCWRIPLNILFKSVPADSDLIGFYDKVTMNCPFQFIGDKKIQNYTFKYSDFNLQDNIEYYFNVVYRETTVKDIVIPWHRYSYAFTYYDDVSQLDGNYTVAFSAPFSVVKHKYNPVIVDDNGEPIKDTDGNPISYGKNYTDNIVDLKNAIRSIAMGGSATAQGGSASVINNNNPTFNNNPSVVVNAGGSGSGGTAQDFDDVDTSTFENLWNSCGNFFSFVKKIWATFPLQASLVSGVFVVLFVLRVARR